MTKVIRFLAQCIDQNTGDVLEESIMNEEVLQKATILPLKAACVKKLSARLSTRRQQLVH